MADFARGFGTASNSMSGVSTQKRVVAAFRICLDPSQ
jgi:hypothetical protein